MATRYLVLVEPAVDLEDLFLQQDVDFLLLFLDQAGQKLLPDLAHEFFMRNIGSAARKIESNKCPVVAQRTLVPHLEGSPGKAFQIVGAPASDCLQSIHEPRPEYCAADDDDLGFF